MVENQVNEPHTLSKLTLRCGEWYFCVQTDILNMCSTTTKCSSKRMRQAPITRWSSNRWTSPGGRNRLLYRIFSCRVCRCCFSEAIKESVEHLLKEICSEEDNSRNNKRLYAAIRRIDNTFSRSGTTGRRGTDENTALKL